MQSIDWVAVLFRWLHVIPAIVLLGGTIFVRFAALPALGASGQAAQWLGAVRKKWAMISGLCILLLLVSGLWNFMMYRLDEVRDTGPLYHALFGVKVLLALAVFFIVSVMSGTSAAFAPMRAKPAKMLTLAAGLGLAIVLISGVLRGVKKDTSLPARPADTRLPTG